MDKTAFYRDVARRWGASAQPKASRIEFYQALARRWETSAPPVVLDSGKGLRKFRELVMTDPDGLRRRLLGHNALRRRKLAREARMAIEAVSVEPDLLSPIGELRYEPSHTQVLAHLMDPRRSPVVGPPLLRAFLELAELPAEQIPDAVTGADVQVQAECWLAGQGRVDIKIDLPEALVLVEVKVDAGEGAEQLKRYHNAISATRGSRDGHLVFLTLPKGAQATSTVPHKHMDFGALLRAWLPFAAPSGQESGYLARYLKSVAMLCGFCGHGHFEDWGFSVQSAAIDLAESL